MPDALHFGTDGWRGVIAADFTFANLERVAQSTATVLQAAGDPGPVVVGHDRRFLAAEHADGVAAVLVGNDIPVVRLTSPAPTPAVSGEVVRRGASAGIVLTASHNPPQFGGYKIKSRIGGSASPELTGQVESHLDTVPVRRLPLEQARASSLWTAADYRRPYLDRLATRVDGQRLREGESLTVVVDSMHGCGDDLIAEFLAASGHQVITLRRDRDPMFGGAGPEPVPERLAGLMRTVVERGADLGIATDGDADRVAAVNEKGCYLSALQITPLLADYLIRSRGERGAIAKTFANTILLDRIAAAHGLPFHVFPIGFKHLVPLLADGSLLIGGEESGGIGVAGYLPERDGVLIGLLLVEMRAFLGRPMSALMDDLWQAHGECHYRRVDLPLATERGGQVVAELQSSPPGKVAGLLVSGIDSLDGIKLHLGEAGWVMVRPSGTEPVLRLYCEARTEQEVSAIIGAVTALVTT